MLSLGAGEVSLLGLLIGSLRLLTIAVIAWPLYCSLFGFGTAQSIHLVRVTLYLLPLFQKESSYKILHMK